MRPGVVVTGLTVGAMALVSVLAIQASGTETKTTAAAAKPTASASASPSPSADPTPTVPALPADSGSGLRVVYSVGTHQVWLVDPKKSTPVEASFEVTPGTVEPAPGSYQVYGRSASGTGTDGKQIEHVVRFSQQAGTVFGFSAAVDGTVTAPDPKTKTGGIRESRENGQALWEFATSGTKVVVVR